MMSESFAELFEQSIEKSNVHLGSIVEGTVVRIGNEYVTISSADSKSEGDVPLEQFAGEKIAVGDKVRVVLDAVEDGLGRTRLSRDKAKRLEAWDKLSEAYEKDISVIGFVSGKVKGGFTVEIQNIRAFLPGSLVDSRTMKDPVSIEGKELEFKVIKLDAKRNNVVVSRRSMAEDSEASKEQQDFLNSLQEGQETMGIVKNLTDYGAFVDLGGIDGLLHITDMAWRRVKHPSEVVSVGQEIKVKVLKFDRERNRVSLGLKQLGDDPWLDITRRYPEGAKLMGKVTNITDYGCFVEIEDGVEGLVHVSEMDWTNKNIHPNKVVQLGSEVEVMVLDIDEERRRISLGVKQCKENPWEAFAGQYNKGDKVSGKIKSITDFGLFIGLDGNIDGLIHLSDISWHESGEEAVRHYKKGMEVEAVVLIVDSERERISLGIKQLDKDPYAAYVAEHAKGTVVQGTVTSVDPKGATVKLADGVDGYLRATEFSRERIEDMNQHLKEGDAIEAKFMGYDRKIRMVTLSIKAKETEEEQDTLRELSRSSAEAMSSNTLGDLLREKMDTHTARNED
jgi:small subunit ribosomal protein S1